MLFVQLKAEQDHISTWSHVTSSHLYCTSLTHVNHAHSTFSTFAWEWGHRVLSWGLMQGDKIFEVHSVLRIKTPNNRCMSLTRKVLRLVCKYNLFFFWCLHSQHLMDSNTKVFNDQICLVLLQLPGQLHGGRQGWSHARLPAQRPAHHHPAQEVQRTHTCHVSVGEEAPSGHHAPHGWGRGPGQQAHRGGALWSPVPWVRLPGDWDQSVKRIPKKQFKSLWINGSFVK